MHARGQLAQLQGDPRRAQQLYGEALAIAFRDDGDRAQLAGVLNSLARSVMQQGALEQAEAVLTESLLLARLQHDSRLVAYALRSIGILALRRQDYPGAEAQLWESLALFWELGDQLMPLSASKAWRSLRSNRARPDGIPLPGRGRGAA